MTIYLVKRFIDSNEIQVDGPVQDIERYPDLWSEHRHVDVNAAIQFITEYGIKRSKEEH